MKKLTVISLVLMIPTMVTSFFGMNIPLPTDSWGGNAPLLVILGVCVLLSGTASVLLRDKRKKKRTDSAWGRLPRLGRKRRE